MKSIRTKIILSLGGITIAVLIILGITSITIMYKFLTKLGLDIMYYLKIGMII